VRKSLPGTGRKCKVPGLISSPTLFPETEKIKPAPLRAQRAPRKGLKNFLNNYTISAISIGFTLSRFPRKTSNTAEMRF
jgi:hypothetical protein